MHQLSHMGLLSGVEVVNLECCKHCVFDKQHKSKFSNDAHITEQMLDYIHSDCWGLSTIKGMIGFCSFILFVDDKSRYTT